MLSHHRVPLLQALIGLFELPEDDSIPEDEHFIEIEDTPGTETNHFFQNLSVTPYSSFDTCFAFFQEIHTSPVDCF